MPPEASAVFCAAAPWRWQAQGLRGSANSVTRSRGWPRPVRPQHVSSVLSSADGGWRPRPIGAGVSTYGLLGYLKMKRV